MKSYIYSFLLFFSLLVFMSEANESMKEEKIPITVWIRSFGIESKSRILPYLLQLDKALSSDFELHFVVVTKPNDPVMEALETAQLGHLEVVQANLDSVSQGLNALIAATDTDSCVLSLSQGVEIEAKHLKEALFWLEKGAWAYGWQLSNMNNDGSLPGKGWYHTACLYPAKCVAWLKKHPFPTWIDAGVDGSIACEGELIPIGGNEEIIVMGLVLQEDPTAFFVHDARNILNLEVRTGTGVTFEQKLKRKVLVTDYYLTKRLQLDPKEVWSHLLVLTPGRSSEVEGALVEE